MVRTDGSGPVWDERGQIDESAGFVEFERTRGAGDTCRARGCCTVDMPTSRTLPAEPGAARRGAPRRFSIPRPRRARGALGALVLAWVVGAAGCDVDPQSPALRAGLHEELLDHAAWVPTPAEDDLWVEHRPERTRCEGGWVVEAEGVEVDTENCNYLALSQSLAVDVSQGTRVRLSAWWQTLAATEPARAHLALAVGGDVVWEEWIEIPGPAEARDVEWDLDDAWPAGSTIDFHLHNHGFNNWKLSSLDVLEVPETTP